MNIGYMTDRGRRRPTNEDSLRACEDLNFFMLADGVGGNRSGEIASQSALDALEKFVRHNPPEWLGSRDEVFRYFRAAVNYVNQFIIKLSGAKPQYAGMATTLTFAYIRGDEMYVANVGDSRVYLAHGDMMQQITDTRAIGANANNEPDCFSVPVEKGDRILLCSDGLYDEVDDDTILSVLNRYKDMKVCAEDLVYMANENGGNDNISVICVDLED